MARALEPPRSPPGASDSREHLIQNLHAYSLDLASVFHRALAAKKNMQKKDEDEEEEDTIILVDDIRAGMPGHHAPPPFSPARIRYTLVREGDLLQLRCTRRSRGPSSRRRTRTSTATPALMRPAWARSSTRTSSPRPRVCTDEDFEALIQPFSGGGHAKEHAIEINEEEEDEDEDEDEEVKEVKADKPQMVAAARRQRKRASHAQRVLSPLLVSDGDAGDGDGARPFRRDGLLRVRAGLAHRAQVCPAERARVPPAQPRGLRVRDGAGRPCR